MGLRTLAIVRCGDKSLHRSWTGEIKDARGFDVAISYFGSNEDLTFSEANYIHRKKAGKWDGIYDFFQEFPETLERYDYFWLPDDDIEATPETVRKMIELADKHQLAAAQPALSHESYYSHLITLRHPQYEVRYTNFVEIMVPLLSQETMKRSLPKFAKTKSGFGLDFIWGKWAEASGEKIGIIDAVEVFHTRPVGGDLHKMIAKTGDSSNSELAIELQGEHVDGAAVLDGVSVPRIKVLEGVTSNYENVSSNLGIAWSLLQFGWKSSSQLQQKSTAVNLGRYALKHVI